jgi:rubredoxin
MKHRSTLRQLKAENRLQPATIVNYNPFPLKVEAGALITFTVPGRKEGEEFAYITITEPKFAFPFKGVISAANGTENVNDYDVLPVLPIQQAMEFFKVYMESTQDMSGGVMGGVLIFEGTIAELGKKNAEVRVPFLEILEDGSAFVSTKTRKLDELRNEALTAQRAHCMAKIQQANDFFTDPAKQKNIVSEHRMYAKLALTENWITALPAWVQSQVNPDDLCPKCHAQTRPTDYMCGNCGKVFDPIVAYQEGDIEYGHVSFQKLTAEEWKTVKKIKAERDKARGGE